MSTVVPNLFDAVSAGAPPASKLSAADFVGHPREPWCELVAGHLRERAMGADSSAIQLWLGYLLMSYLAAKPIGHLFDAECGYQCFADADTVRKPDLSFIRAGRLAGEKRPAGWITIPPDLAVEVVSSRDLASELDRKVEQYRSAGVRLTWVVWPDTRRIDIHRVDGSTVRRTDADFLDGEDVLPGFRCEVAAVFSPPQPTAEGA